jgi:hypothetical protein
MAASASSSGDAPSATSVLSPYSRFDVLDEAAARCDELRRMTDDDPFQACSKRLAHKTSKALIDNMDVPAPWIEALGNPFADWFKSRYSKEAIRLLQFDFASNLCFVSGMPFVVPSKSSGTFYLLELVGSHCSQHAYRCWAFQAASMHRDWQETNMDASLYTQSICCHICSSLEIVRASASLSWSTDWIAQCIYGGRTCELCLEFQ